MQVSRFEYLASLSEDQQFEGLLFAGFSEEQADKLIRFRNEYYGFSRDEYKALAFMRFLVRSGRLNDDISIESRG